MNKMNRYSKKEDSSPLPGAAYIRYSSEMQSDSFSLDVQLRQIKEQAEHDGVEIVKMFADPAPAYHVSRWTNSPSGLRPRFSDGDGKSAAG